MLSFGGTWTLSLIINTLSLAAEIWGEIISRFWGALSGSPFQDSSLILQWLWLPWTLHSGSWSQRAVGFLPQLCPPCNPELPSLRLKAVKVLVSISNVNSLPESLYLCSFSSVFRWWFLDIGHFIVKSAGGLVPTGPYSTVLEAELLDHRLWESVFSQCPSRLG